MMELPSLSTGLLLLSVFLLGLCECRQIASPDDNLPSGTGQRPVELAWGIADVQTPVGRLFNFTIPKDAFDGEILDIKVTEVDKPSLPDWLIFDPSKRIFVGLPTNAKDIGRHYVAVTVFGAQNSLVQDVFSLAIKESPSESQCLSDAAESILTIFLDIDWDHMTMDERVALLIKFSNYMDIPVAQFKISTMTGIAPSTLFDVSAIMAGPGNAKEVKFSGIKLSTIVGCDGDLSGSHNKELVAFVEEAAKDGSMARFTGINVIGWHLTTSKPILPSRVRRQSNFLNTPEPSPISPTIIQQPGTPVVNTPYLSGTPGVDSNVGISTPEIQPTGVSEVTVAPTTTVPLDGATPQLNLEEIISTPPPLPPPKPSPRTKKPPVPGTVQPKVGQPIGDGKEVVFVSGEQLEFLIPLDAFGTPDGSKQPVTILEAEKTPWLQVITKDGRSRLVGLPLLDDARTYDLHLEGANEAGLIQIPMKIGIKSHDETKLNHEIGVVLDEPFDQFNLTRRLQFVDTLRSYYHDPNTKNIAIRSIQAGSTHVTWTNQSLIAKDCSDQSIKSVISAVQNPDNQVNPEFLEYFKKAGDFKVDKVVVKKLGPCAEGSAAKEAEKDIYLSTILPIAVVACLLLLACCIGCFLYRKKKRGKMSTESEQMFVGKNKPVILPGEISDNNNNKGTNGNGKKPTVLAEERHPIAPPVYPGRTSPNVRGQGASNVNQYDDRDPSEQHPLLHLSSDPQPHLELVPPSSRK